MRSRPKHLGFLTATLLLSLTSPLQLPGKILGISGAMAAKSGQNSGADREQLSMESSPQFLIAGSLNILPAFSEECNPNRVKGFTRNLGKENLKENLQRLQQQLAIHQNAGNRSGEAEIINEIGLIYICLKDYSKALEWHQKALVIYEEIGDRTRKANTIGYIGNAYFKTGQYSKIEDLFRQKLESLRKNGDREGEQRLLNIMRYSVAGSEAGGIGEWFLWPAMTSPPANLSWQEMLEITKLNLFINREIADRKAEGHSLHGIGWTYRNLGKYTQAINFYQQALVVARERRDFFHEAFVRVDIGVIYMDLGKYDLALEYFQQTLQFVEKNQPKIGFPQPEIDILSKIGWVYKVKEQYKLALYFLQKALSKQKLAVEQGFISRQRPDIVNNIGSVYFLMGDYTKALEFYQEALEQPSWTPSAKVFAINNIGLVYTQRRDYTQALETYQKALALFRELKDMPGERIILSNIGALLAKQNQVDLAIVFYKQAVNISESIRQNLQTLTIEEQKTYTETVADSYRSLADLLLSQGRILEAQHVLELLKVQELRDFTRDSRAGGETPGIATNRTEAEILKIHGTLIALGREIEKCQQCAERSQLLDEREVIAKEFEQTVRALEQEIRSRREQDKAFLDPSTLGGNAENIVSAQPGTILIYPLVLQDKLWILWAAQGGITKSIEVPDVGLKQLSETIVKFRQLLQNPTSDIAEVKATGKQLYDWLIPESLQKELKENKIQNLVFSLDRVTRYIPMSAVFDGEKYLTENYNISTILSANLTQMSDRLPPGTENTSVLALGVSDAVANFNPLPNVPQELDAIVRQSPADPQGIYPGVEFLNKAFDRRALRDNLAGHLILHVATHGEFVPGSADNSYLLLGNGDKLPIPEVQSLRDLSKIHLVVLSACETALGETGQDGTEIAGLSYYFLNGGAKAVMASLWQVDDESTRLLMEQFYKNLANSTADSPITKAKALRQAQLSLIHSARINTPNTDSRSLIVEPLPGAQTSTTKASGFSHPYYWAPFILIGNSL
jgi:CHAT domain-containing protein/Tfp pilus assembly protein PilF